MNLRHVRTFVGIAEAGGIARAGASLNLSQPAASRQILALEAEFGVRLFDRIGRRFQLSSEGEDLLRQSRRLLMEAESLTARAHALKRGDTGILRVGATSMVIENSLSRFLRHYRRGHPGVEVHLVEDGGVRLPRRLEHGDVHLALVIPDERFRSRLLYPVYDLAVLLKQHPLSRRRTIDVAELADEPLLLLNRSFGSREWFDAACSVAHIPPRVLLESTAPHAVVALSAAGYGIAVIPSTMLVPSSLRAVPLVQRAATIGRWLTVASDPQRLLPTYAEEFADELAVYCKRAYPGREFTGRAPSLRRPSARTS